MHVALLLAALVGAEPAPVPAEPAPEAPATVDVEVAAEALVQQGRLEEALALLEEAYYASESGRPRLLFGMGIIELERDDCESAVGYLGRFLATEPADGAAARAREVIAYCDEQLRARTEAKTGEAPLPEDAPATTAPVPVVPEEEVEVDEPSLDDDQAWYRDGLGWGLAGTGIVVTAVGGGLLAQAQGDVRRARGTRDEAEFDQSLSRVTTLRVVGVTLTGVGASLLVGAAIRYGVVARRHRRASVALDVGSGVALIRMSTRF